MENKMTTNNQFDPAAAYKIISEHWTFWDNTVKPKRYVVGISGGIDSSCVSALACKIFGKERVTGVSMPCGGQSDMWAVDMLFNSLGINKVTIDIGNMFSSLMQNISDNQINISETTRINAPARLRMTTLFGVAQSIDGIVVNTCNYSESCQGYDTLFGDDCGSYAPIQDLTKTEVKALSEWLGLPRELVNKTPIDGLQPLSDEERLGITYSDLDAFIRGLKDIDDDLKTAVLNRYKKNKFKMDMIKLPGPRFDYLTNVIRAIY